MESKENILNEIIRTYLTGDALINLSLPNASDSLDSAIAELSHFGPVNYKRYENDLLLIAYANDAEQLYVSKYVKENKPVQLEGVDDKPFTPERKENTIELIKEAYINGAEIHLTFHPSVDEQEAYDLVSRFGEPKHEVNEDDLPLYRMINLDLNLEVICLYGETAYRSYHQRQSNVLQYKRTRKLEFDSVPEMYLNPIKNMKRDYYLKPYGIITILLVSFILLLLTNGDLKGLFLVLNLLTFPYVILWVKSSTFYNRTFYSGSTIDHIKYILKTRKIIDQRTGDDVSRHTHSTVSRYGRVHSQTTENRSRKTADNRKFDFSYWFVVKNTIVKLVLYIGVIIFSFILYIIAVPQLNKKGLLNYLAY